MMLDLLFTLGQAPEPMLEAQLAFKHN